MRALLIRCYPARWRARYGDEFEAVLEEQPLGPFDVADILLGALDAHLRLRRRAADRYERTGIPMSLRVGGFAAILGGALWFAGMFTVAEIVTASDGLKSILMLVGSVALLVAMTGLSAFQARAHPVLTWTAFALPAFGTIFCAVGAYRGSWTESITGILLTFLGTVLFAIVTDQTNVFSRRGAQLLGIGSAASLLTLVIPPPLAIAAWACFAVGWLVLGFEAIRLGRPIAASRPA